MVFTRKTFTDLVEKEIIILINSERYEIAKRLRILASHAPVDAELINDLLGLYPGEYIDGYDPCNIQHLADLIEPKECMCKIERDCDMIEDGFSNYLIWKCSCGEMFPYWRWDRPVFCPGCGGKVVEDAN